MNKLWKSLMMVMVAFLVLIGLGGCQPSDSQQTNDSSASENQADAGNKDETTEASNGESGQSLVYGLNTAPDGKFHPFYSDSTYDTGIGQTIFASMLTIDENLELQPSLAESYEVQDDGKKLLFKLKPDLKWSDGEDLTAEDVEFSLESLANPNYQGPFVNYVEGIAGYKDFQDGTSDHLEGIKLLNETDIEINFETPYAPALTNIGILGLIPKHIWSNIKIEEWEKNFDPEHLIGAGPFILQEYKDGEYVKLKANENFYAGQPKSEELIFKVINESSLLVELEAGDVDIVDVSNMRQKDKDSLKEQGFELHEHENSMIQVMGVNATDPALSDPILHQAIISSIDRDGLIQSLLEGNGKKVNTLVLENSWAYPKENKMNDYPYDVEAAKNLLQENGYSYEDDSLMKDGQPVTLDLIVPTGDEAREQTGQVIQENLKQLGIDVNLNTMEFNAMMDIIFAEEKDYQTFLMGSNQSVDPDISAYWQTGGAWNITGYSRPEMDQALELGKSSLDLDDRKTAYADVAHILNEDLPFIPLYSQNVQIVSGSNVKGFNPSLFRDYADAHLWEIAE